jgi:hypothetical protein
MISWLGSGASPPPAPHPGGERPGKRAPLGLSFAKLKHAPAGCVVVVKAVPELQPSNWPPCPLIVPGKEAFPGPCRVQHSSVFAATLRPTLETVLLNKRSSAP